MNSRIRTSMSPKSRRSRSSPVSASTRSAANERGSAIVRRAREELRRSLRDSRQKNLRRSPRRLELVLRGLEQLLLRREARALNRSGKLHPLDVVDFAELRLHRAAAVHHQVEIDSLVDERVA